MKKTISLKFKDLPIDVLLYEIAEYLNPQNLGQLLNSSKLLNSVFSEEYWQNKLDKSFPDWFTRIAAQEFFKNKIETTQRNLKIYLTFLTLEIPFLKSKKVSYFS